MQGQPINTPSRQRFQNLLAAYLTLNRRDRKEIITRKARSVAIALYESTIDAAPSEAKIKQDVLKLGWRVKRAKDAWPLDAKKGEGRGSKGPLNRMRAAQIGRRQKARGSVASGWLPAVRKLRGAGSAKKKQLVQIKKPRGGIIISEPNPQQFMITIFNSTPGVVKVENKHRVLQKSLNNESRDILKYIRQKIRTGSGAGVGGNG